MALIECPDCGRRVSDAADTCIGCGRPLHESGEYEQTVLIEQSGKRWKALILTGLAMLLIGFIMLGVGGGEGASAAGGLLVIVGALTFIFSVIGRWWHHG